MYQLWLILSLLYCNFVGWGELFVRSSGTQSCPMYPLETDVLACKSLLVQINFPPGFQEVFHTKKIYTVYMLYCTDTVYSLRNIVFILASKTAGPLSQIVAI